MNSDKPMAGRLYFLDNIKLALIVLVIVHHAGQAYGPTDYWPIRSDGQWQPLGAFFDVNGAFFMGLFFMISAYFLPATVDRKGIGRLVADRIIRLGIPLIVMTIFVFGPITWAVDQPALGFWDYMVNYYIGQGDFELAHLWFLSLLLVFTSAYLMWGFMAGVDSSRIGHRDPPGHRLIWMTVAGLVLANAAIRFVFPVGEWVDLMPLLPIEPARMPQYALFFALGIIAARHNWLMTIDRRLGMIWLAIGLAAAGLRFLTPMPEPVWLIVEALIGVGLCVGLPVIGRELVDRDYARWTPWADTAFAAYLVHIIIVYLLQAGMEHVSTGPAFKFLAVSIAGVLLSFTLAAMLRRIPGFVRVL